MPSFFYFLIEIVLCELFPQNHSISINLNYFLRKELAKIKLSNIKKVSKAHLQLEIRKLANEPFSSTHLDRKDEDEALKHNLLPYKTKKRTIAKNELCVISVRHPD